MLLTTTRPAASDRSALLPQRPGCRRSSARAKPLISIIDDDKSTCEATGGLIKSLRFRFQVFASAEEF
jgi:hypothetical protein